MESHPETNEPYHVLLGRLGAFVLHNGYCTPYR